MNDTGFEQKRIVQKIKEYFSLFVYIIIILAFSICIMDVIIFPSSVYAVNNSESYTRIFLISFIIMLGIYIFTRITLSIIRFIKDGLSIKEIACLFIKRRCVAVFTFFLIILFGSFVVLTAKFLLEQNYYFIYKILK